LTVLTEECIESRRIASDHSVLTWTQSKQQQQHSAECQLPPSLWCSSRSIAEKCKVVQQCSDMVWSPSQSKGLHDDDRVHFALYYESLCPGCKVMVEDQLWPTYQQIGSIINLDLVPYGNAHETQDGDSWIFTCQHGPEECLGNLIETCSIHVSGGINASFPFIACMEMSDQSIKDSASQCAKDHGVDLSAIMQCVNGPVGNKLEHAMAVKTDQLDPPHHFVPWVTLNGEHTDEIQERAQSDLLGLICDTYKGPNVPKACKKRRESLPRCQRGL